MTDYFTPSDRDYIIRTVIGESAGQPDEGQAAVAHVILNRVKNGFGRTPTEVIFAKNQFEPWSTRRSELLSYAPTDPAYSKAAKIVDDVIGGKIKDPTSGATHFLQEETVRARRGGGLPDWAQGKQKRIGAHSFFRPDDPEWGDVQTVSLVDKYTKAAPGSASVSAPSSAEPAPLEEGLSLIERYTKKPAPPKIPAPGTAQIGTAPAFQVPAPGEITATATPAPSVPGFVGQSAERLAGGMRKDLPKVAAGVAAVPGRFGAALGENIRGGLSLAREGIDEIAQGNLLPSGELTDPSTWRAGGIAKVGGGALSAGLAPVTAARQELVERPVRELTGNPEFAERSGLVFESAVPSAAATRGVNRLRPTVRAQESIGGVPLTGDELSRLRANPRLTPMDVNPTMRQMAMGAYNEPGPAKSILFQRVEQRKASAPEAVREAYDAAGGPAPIVPEVLRAYKKTASDNARKGFGEAFKNVQFVDASPVVKKIDAELKPGVTELASPGTQIAWGPLEQRLARLRKELTDGRSLVTDPMRLHEIQYTLGREIRDLSKSSVGSERHMARNLGKVHETLVKQIDDATGGKYQPARKKFKEDMEIQEAFEKGFEIFDTGKGMGGQLQDSPAAWREWITGKDSKGKKIGEPATKEEIDAMKLGARSEIERRISAYRHSARRGADIDDVPWNHEKMELLFGKKEAGRLQQLLRDERDIATTNSKLTANSDTAERLTGREMVKVRSEETPSNLGTIIPPVAAEMMAVTMGAPVGVGTALGGGAIASRFVGNRLGRRSDIARNTQLADILSQGGEQGRQALIQSMHAAASKNRLLPKPALPVTYVPSEKAERRPVPLQKD